MSTSAQDETAPAQQGPVSRDTETFRAAHKPNSLPETEIGTYWPEFSHLQFDNLSRAVRRIRQLRPMREDAIAAQVHRREMMREVAFKRDQVSTCDSNLMRRYQTLVAQGKLNDHPDLLELFSKCQDARDVLGPLENEAIDAEQSSEWKWTKVEKAEELAYTSLFDLAENLPSVSSGSSLHDFESGSEHDDFEIDIEGIETQNNAPHQRLPTYSTSTLSLMTPQSSIQNAQIYGNMLSQFSPESDTVPDHGRDLTLQSISTSSQSHGSSFLSPSVIDHGLESRPHEYSIPRYEATESNTTTPNSNPRLLLDFTTIRERINNWLLYGVLLSRLEAKALKIQLDAKSPKSPSNWAQLAIAWWNKDDDTAASRHPQILANENLERAKHPSIQLGRSESLSDSVSSEKGWDIKLPSQNINANENQTLSPQTSKSKENLAFVGESKVSSTAATIGAREYFVLLLVEHEQLKPLFDRARNFETIIEGFRLRALVVTLVANLLRETSMRDASERKLASLLGSDPSEIANAMEIKIYGRRLENPSQPKFKIADDSMPDLTRYTAPMKAEIPIKFTRDVRQSESHWDAANDINSSQLSKSFQEFVLQSKAFREFCDACRKIFGFQGEIIPLEDGWNLVHDRSRYVDQMPSHESSHLTEGPKPVQANSGRKREVDIEKVDSELSLNRIRNNVKIRSHTYSDAVSHNMPPARGVFSRTKTAPSLPQPIPVSIQRQKDGNLPKLESPLGKLEDDDSGSKTPTPADAKNAKSRLPQALSHQSLAATSHATKVVSTRGSSINCTGQSSWLRGDFKQHKKGDFACGKVFKICWSQDDGGEYETVISLQTIKRIENFNLKIKHFVIIDKREDHCICLPIVNYNGHRFAKTGIKDEDYATICVEPPRWVERENKLEKPPILVQPFTPQEKLPNNSKLMYSKRYRVYYDVEVCFIGQIDQNSERVLRESCKEVHLPFPMGNRNIQPPPPPPPPLISVRGGITYAQVAALPDPPNTLRLSTRSFSSSIPGRDPRSQSTQPSVFSMKSSGPPWASRQNTFPMSSVPSQATMLTKARFSTSPTRRTENTAPRKERLSKDEIYNR